MANNPLNAIDPLGMRLVDCVWDECPHGGGGGGGGGGNYNGDYAPPTQIDVGPLAGLGSTPQWYLDEVNNGWANLAHPDAPPVDPAATNIWVYCNGTVSGGTLTSVGCAPPSQAVAGSVAYTNYGLSVGLDIWHCPGCGATWRNASGAANAAAVATGAVVVGVPAAAEAAVLSEGIGWNVAGKWGAFRQFTIYNTYGNLFSVGVDAINGWHIGLGASATGRSLFHLPLNPINWPWPW